MPDFITNVHFSKHLAEIAPSLFVPRNKPKPIPIGVCVSGGPDSMALAYLLAKIPQRHGGFGRRLFAVHSFIVDHGVREGSSDEAEQVSKNLLRFGIPSSIITLSWTRDELENFQRHGFEEHARKRRYPEIVEKARRMGISNFFTGHHRDDQMETLLMRMIRNQTQNLLSFRGIQDVSTVPCCEKVPGARSYSMPEQLERTCHTDKDTTEARVSGEANYAVPFRLIRPMLVYEKDKIIATCKRFSIPYVEDKTNDDPTFTTRNAVRVLRKQYVLPRALQNRRLDTLQARAQSITDRTIEEAVMFSRSLKKLQVLDRVGAVRISFSHLPDSSSKDKLRGFSYFMARMLELASPISSEEWPQLLDAKLTGNLLEELRKAQTPPPESNRRPSVLTLAGKVSMEISAENNREDQSVSVMLYRQPMRLSELAQNHIVLHLPHEKSSQGWRKSNWVLWDNRFWVSVWSKVDHFNELLLRPLLPEDMAAVRGTFERNSGETSLAAFNQILSTEAIGRVRYSLPVLVYKENVIAFPSLGIRVPGPYLPLARDTRFVIRLPRNTKVADLLQL